MEALAVKQQIEVEQRMPVQVAESLRYARKEPADMPFWSWNLWRTLRG